MSKVDFKFEGTKLKASVSLDPNGDGESVLAVALEIDLAEIPDEVVDAISKKKAAG